MVFVIDIGNTNVSLAGVTGETVHFTGKADTNREWNADIYYEKIAPILGDPKQYEGSILSSVVPQVTPMVCAAVERLLGKAPMVIGIDTDTGLTLDVEFPEKVGRDRLVDSCWAANHMPLPAVTADLGTATTLNVILPGNIFAGGVICAGIQTGLIALSYRAAQLPKLELEVPKHVIGKNTQECMLSGAVAGTAGMLDGLVLGIEEELGTKVSLVITGGGGEYVSPLVRHEHVYDKNVTLKGLALLFERNERVL